MMSERTTLIRLAALCLMFVPMPVAFAFSETDLATLEETGSCSGCDLSGADLYEADLFQADLSLSDLSGADLTAADLTLANLRSVDLRGAILEEANLSGANLAKVLLDKDVLAGAIFDSERTRTTLGFKDLKLGMNAVEVAQYCSLNTRHLSSVIHGTPRYSALNPDKPTYSITAKQLGGTCFDNADMPFIFKFSGGGTTGVLNFLQVGLAPYTKKGQRKFIDLLAKKYDPARSYSAQDVEAFNNNRELDIKRLHTIFANGQVTLSIVGEGAGLQMLLTYRDIEHSRRFLKLKGGPAPVDLTHLPPITTDLYKLVGNYKLKGIGAKGTSTNHGRIDTAYLEIDAFENELAGELVISGHGMSERFRIIGIEKISGNRLTVQLEPVTGTIPDGEPLRMSLEFAEDGDSFTGKWTNWFNKSRRPDDFKGSRSQSFWQTAMSHNRIDMYQAYLRLRPGGIYSAVARSRITALGGTLAAPSAPTVATAATASPSTPTTAITTTVDPLVGIWTRVSGFHGDCHFIVGQRDDGTLTAVSFQGFLRRNVIGNDSAIEWGLTDTGVGILARAISIKRTPKGAYSWQSSDNFGSLGLPGFMANPPKKGSLSISKDKDGNPRVSSNTLCVEDRAAPPTGTYQKLPLNEAIAMELPRIAQKDFPSPFATEGSQVATVPKATASATAAPSTPTPATAITVDPLVGIWQQTDLRYENCQLVVGQDSRGQLMGISFSTINRGKLIENDGPRYPKGTVDWSPSNSSKGFVARKLTIEQGPGGTYTWTSEISFRGNMWEAPTAKSGKIYLSTDQNGNPRISTKKLCMVERAAAGGGSFSKLALDEAIAMELPSIAQKDFPSPFATEGSQVATVPKATASATAAPSTPTPATAITVDPLVGVWLRERSGKWAAPFCYAIFGQKPDGTLLGVSWEQALPTTYNESWWTPGYEYRDVPPRKLAIKPRNNNSYNWQTNDIGHLPGDGAEFRPPTVMQGILSINITGEKTTFSSATNKPLCRRHKYMTSPNRTYYKLSLEAAATLELPAEVEQLLLSGIIPSPFELNTQWGSSMLIGQEVTGTVQTTGATPDSNDSDQR